MTHLLFKSATALLFLTLGTSPALAQEGGPAKDEAAKGKEDTPKSADKSVAAKALATGSELKAWSPEILLVGGSIFPWDKPEETGNVVGVSASIQWDLFRVGLSYTAVLPDSRSQGLYSNFSADFTWFFVQSIGASNISPYLVTGIGVAFADEPPELRIGDPPHIRWNEANSVFGMLGVGVRYGLRRGLYVGTDFRAYNLTHGGVNFTAGYRF